MSLQAEREQPARRHLCGCGRHALYRSPAGKLKARTDHVLCQACYRDERNRFSAVWILPSRSRSVRGLAGARFGG